MDTPRSIDALGLASPRLGEERPLAVVIGEGEYSDRLSDLFREHLSHECSVVPFPSTEDAAHALGCTPQGCLVDAPIPIAILAVVVGEDTPTADMVMQPIAGCEEFADTRLVVLSTSLKIKGVDWLVDKGRLDWVGYAEDLRTDAFVESMKAQVTLFHEHKKFDSIPELSSLFEQPFSDSEIIRKVLRRIERSLGSQPRISLPEGIRLTTKGAWVEEVTIILSGSVALIHESPSGDIVMHEESTGRIIGLLAVSEGRRALLNAVTTSEVTGVRLTVEQLNSAIQDNPDITLLVATLFIRSLDRRLRRAEELHIENRELSEQVETERALLATALSNLEEARTELLAQERLASLGSLSAGIAHELNNPLAAIQRMSEYLGEDVARLLETAPSAKWSRLALQAMRSGEEAPSLTMRAEREVRRELTRATGDASVAQRLSLAGIRDPELARKLTRRSSISLEGAEQAASIGTQLRNMRSASARIVQLVSSLRSYARPDGDTVVGVDLHGNLDDVIRLLSHALGPVEVVRSYEELPPVECHPGQLAQVWTNVLTNAAEAIIEANEKREQQSQSDTNATKVRKLAEPGAPVRNVRGEDEKVGRVEIRTSSLSPDWIRVEVIDDGPGIPANILPHVFEPRFTTKSGQVRFGMGIGLGVARTIVGKHHGTMRIRTGPTGTTVIVDLPISAPKEEQ